MHRAVLRHDAAADPEADRARRWVARRDTAEGMVRIEAKLHPEAAALVWAALDHRAQRLCREAQRDSAETSRAPVIAAQAVAPAVAAARDRRGRRLEGAPPPSRPPGLGWEAILAHHEESQITAAANEPLWDGAPIDYGAVIDALVGLEQTEGRQGWS